MTAVQTIKDGVSPDDAGGGVIETNAVGMLEYLRDGKAPKVRLLGGDSCSRPLYSLFLVAHADTQTRAMRVARGARR